MKTQRELYMTKEGVFIEYEAGVTLVDSNFIRHPKYFGWVFSKECDNMHIVQRYAERNNKIKHSAFVFSNRATVTSWSISDVDNFNEILQRGRNDLIKYEYHKSNNYHYKTPKTISITYDIMPITTRAVVICAYRALNNILCSDLVMLVIAALLELIRRDSSWYTEV